MCKTTLQIFAVLLFMKFHVKECGGQGQAVNYCRDGGNGHLGPKSCCNDITFTLGHLSSQGVKVCMVEPADPNLSFVDSYWEHYFCIVKEILGSEPLTATSYVTMMAKNLPEPLQKEIFNLYESNLKATVPDESGLTVIQRLKQYWRAYFDSDFFVCGAAVRQKGTFKDTDRRFWEPSYACAGEPIPYIAMVSAIDFDKFFTELEKCEQKFRGLINSRRAAQEWETQITDACEFIVDEEIKFEDLMNSTLDFNHLYQKHDTTIIWSKNVKEMMLTNFKAKLLDMGFKDEDGFPFKNFETNVQKIIPLRPHQRKNEGLRQFYINSQALTVMLDALLDIREKKICAKKV